MVAGTAERGQHFATGLKHFSFHSPRNVNPQRGGRVKAGRGEVWVLQEHVTFKSLNKKGELKRVEKRENSKGVKQMRPVKKSKTPQETPRNGLRFSSLVTKGKKDGIFNRLGGGGDELGERRKVRKQWRGPIRDGDSTCARESMLA